MKEPFTFRFDTNLSDQLQKVADEEGRSLANLLNSVLTDCIETDEQGTPKIKEVK